jgi:thiamine-monophosphate kinase
VTQDYTPPTVAQMDEFSLIETLIKPNAGTLPSEITCGIGDDCAVISRGDGTSLLLSTDMTIEGIHFTTETISAHELGIRAIVSSVSDIAAMGGRVEYVLVSLALPGETQQNWVRDFFLGVSDTLSKIGIPLVGGDTGRSKAGIYINITVIGSVPDDMIKLRSAAKAGDVVCVSGCLGDSKAGLHLISQKSRNSDPMAAYLIRQHLTPELSLKEGEWLGQQSSVHAMMDLSDGLASDLRHIAKASHVGIEVDVETLPLSMELRTIADRLGWKAPFFAASGGEEYVLLLTVSRLHFSALARSFEERFRKPLHRVGSIVPEVEGNAEVSFHLNGVPCNDEVERFHHFS